MMGGEVNVTSESGKGSTFTIRLPAEVRELPEEPARRAPASADSLPIEGNTVLVIDDEAPARDLQLAKKIRPTVITLDVMMPGMYGWAVLSALKGDPELAEIPVIMLTIVDDKNLGYALGAADYVPKPVDRDRLLTALQRFRHLPEPHLVLIVEDDDATRN